jgi:hypothetical protein
MAWIRSIGIGDDPKPTGARYRVTGRWVYRDRDGEPVYRVVRRDCPGKPKRIHQERYDAATGSYRGEKGCMAGVRLVPYRLGEWVDEDSPILIAEGERKVDVAFELGFLATCNPGGAGSFSRGFSQYFVDRDTSCCRTMTPRAGITSGRSRRSSSRWCARSRWSSCRAFRPRATSWIGRRPAAPPSSCAR